MSADRTPPKATPADFVIEPGAEDEPPIGAEVRSFGIRWDLLSTLLLRLMAAVWMLKGIGYWALILGLGDLPLEEESRLRQAVIVTFALLDCAAAVGLWLLTPWGKSVWLFVALTEIGLGLTGSARVVGLTSVIGASLAVFTFLAVAFVERRSVR